MERRGEGAVRHAGNQSLSNFRFHAEKKAEHTRPPPPCAAVFIAAPRPRRRSACTPTQTHRKRHEDPHPWSITTNFFFFSFSCKSGKPIAAPGTKRTSFLSEIGAEKCIICVVCSVLHIRSISLTPQVVVKLNQTSLRTTVTIATFQIF